MFSDDLAFVSAHKAGNVLRRQRLQKDQGKDKAQTKVVGKRKHIGGSVADGVGSQRNTEPNIRRATHHFQTFVENMRLTSTRDRFYKACGIDAATGVHEHCTIAFHTPQGDSLPQYGLFASHDLSKGTNVTFYDGHAVSSSTCALQEEPEAGEPHPHSHMLSASLVPQLWRQRRA
jgi:prepilin-type processing-associated H-X9-DG protein